MMDKSVAAWLLLDAAVKARQEYDTLVRRQEMMFEARLYEDADDSYRRYHTLYCQWSGAWEVLRKLGHLEA
jgi:hypothetical protein